MLKLLLQSWKAINHKVVTNSGISESSRRWKIRSQIHKLINSIWNKEELPAHWKESIITPVHKKGDKTDCSNYRGISLLSTAYKILSNILFSRLSPYIDKIIGDVTDKLLLRLLLLLALQLLTQHTNNKELLLLLLLLLLFCICQILMRSGSTMRQYTRHS
jgi:hypothetical protein